MVLCVYDHPNQSSQHALLLKEQCLAGYKELMANMLSVTSNIYYKGKNCYIPKIDTSINTFIECTTKIMTQRYKDFLYNNSGHLREGIMSLSKIGAFNKNQNMNLVYYNDSDRHLYPKEYRDLNTDNMILYLHENHFCLIAVNNKTKGIKEIRDNLKKEYTCCNDINVSSIANYKIYTDIVKEDDTFAWDLEACPNSDKDHYFQEYAAGNI